MAMSERFASHDPAHGDTAGVPWQGRRLGSTGFDSDGGDGDAALMAALTHPDDAPGLVAAVSGARLIVPIVAIPGDHASSEMAAVTLTSPDGERALPAFTSVDVLGRWDDQARPVPVSAQRAALAATQEGCSVMVLDPGSPWSATLRASMVRALAEGRRWTPPHADDVVGRAVGIACAGEPSVSTWRTVPEDTGALVVELGLRPGLTQPALNEVVRRVGERIAADDEARSRIDAVSFRLTTAP